MIINSITAKNVLKFEQLELSNLPEEGIIAISGVNESGKSTIGETICFALFGRTFSIDNEHLKKIVRWGASECSVTIQFTIMHLNEDEDEGEGKSASASSKQYAITRMLDFAGNHSAKLFYVNDADNPIARGIKQVENALYELSAIKFEEYIESFYLAQREITTPHPHSYTLKSMAGISTLEQCNKQLHQEMAEDNKLSDSYQVKKATLQDEINDLSIDEQLLDSLELKHLKVVQAKDQTDKMLADYQSHVQQYQAISTRIKSSLSKVESSSFARLLFFVISVITFFLWAGMLIIQNETIHGELISFIQSYFPQFDAAYYPFLLYTSIISAVLFLILWLPVIDHNKSIELLDNVGIELSKQMHALDISRNINADSSRLHHLNQLTRERVSEPDLIKFTQQDLKFLIQQQKTQHDQSLKLSSDLVIERERIKQFTELQRQVIDCQTQIDEITVQNNVRTLACELLMGATQHLSTRFNQTLREHVSKTLPLFTDNRYERLQIDDDLTVRIFSNDKYDFMELDEISSGTQRQIMLAVRLALSQEMVTRKVHSRQFMILDEPFAFFDETRTEKSLQELPQLSQDLTQVWIIAQVFPQNMSFSKTIYCERDIIKKFSE